MKKADFQKTFSIEKTKTQTTFERYVQKTAELIKRPYIQTFKLVEDWQEHKIIRRYNECVEYNGSIPKDVLWWSLRKKDATRD